MWYNIGYGTTCEIRDGSASDTDTGAIRAQLILPKSIANVKLVAGDVPWTDNWKIEDVLHQLAYKYEPAPLPDLGDGTDEVTPTPDPGATTTSGTETTPAPATEAPTAIPEPTFG